MAKQIEMNYKLESGYEVIYPNVILNSVTDWTNSIYSKSEIDSKVSQLSLSINNAQMNPGGWETLGTFNGNRSGTTSGGYYQISGTTTISVTFSMKHIYWLVIKFVGSYSLATNRSSWFRCFYSYGGVELFENSSTNNRESFDYSATYCLIPGRTNGKNGWYITSGPSWNRIQDEPYNYLDPNTTNVFTTNANVDNYNYGSRCSLSQNSLTLYRQKINNLP